ncbi:hypothetical protein [Brachybacterium sp. GCM10030252]|uniref:hypothetical protein n=1 Tax=Brachybacterium sp. GCM10030252 TaxID=3273380 RepID=UPI0036220047
MNTSEMPENREMPESAANHESAGNHEAPESAANPEGAERPAAPDPEATTLYVRRRRTPTLGFWVALALAVPAVVALVAAPLLPLEDAGSALNLVLLAVVFIGLPLAAIAALVDAIRHRRHGRRDR